jgi:hypothetical protein
VRSLVGGVARQQIEAVVRGAAGYKNGLDVLVVAGIAEVNAALFEAVQEACALRTTLQASSLTCHGVNPVMIVVGFTGYHLPLDDEHQQGGS